MSSRRCVIKHLADLAHQKPFLSSARRATTCRKTISSVSAPLPEWVLRGSTICPREERIGSPIRCQVSRSTTIAAISHAAAASRCCLPSEPHWVDVSDVSRPHSIEPGRASGGVDRLRSGSISHDFADIGYKEFSGAMPVATAKLLVQHQDPDSPRGSGCSTGPPDSEGACLQFVLWSADTWTALVDGHARGGR